MNDLHRYELKFILNERELSYAMSWLNKIGVHSPYPIRSVNSLYYDNVTHEAVESNLSGLPHRHKVRLRWYGEGSVNAHPIIEIKSRNGRLGFKERYKMPFDSLYAYKKPLHKVSKKIFQHFSSNYFESFLLKNFLVSRLFVTYERNYYEYIDQIRMTIDKNVMFSQPIQSISLKSLGHIRYHNYILEIKFPIESKKLVSNLIRTLKLTPKRHSKFLVGLSMIGNVTYI